MRRDAVRVDIKSNAQKRLMCAVNVLKFLKECHWCWLRGPWPALKPLTGGRGFQCRLLFVSCGFSEVSGYRKFFHIIDSTGFFVRLLYFAFFFRLYET